MLRLFLILNLWTALAAAADAPAEPVRAEFAMDSDPVLTLPAPIKVYSEEYAPLWLEALNRPEADIQRQAAETIAQGHEFGIPGLTKAAPRLLEIVQADATHPAVRFAAARALIALDVRDAAPDLFQASLAQGGLSFRHLVETALAAWKDRSAADAWRDRLSDDQAHYRDLLLAIRGAQSIQDAQAVPLLLQVVYSRSRQSAARLAAARAAGAVQPSGLEEDALRLFDTEDAPALVDRQCAVELLGGHSGVVAARALSRLAQDSEPTVAAPALARLNALDHNLVLPLAEGALANADPKVREEGVAAYAALPTVPRVQRLAGLLDDPHPQVRGRVCAELTRLARQSAELDGPIRESSLGVLNADGWRGQEQSALLLGALDHEPAAGRLVTLLASPRGEVAVAAAWSLRKLAVAETLPAMLEQATRQTDRREARRVTAFEDAQVAHLCEAFGLLGYAAAEPLLRRYIPKDYRMGELSRGGAVWALGQLYAGRADEPLAKLLVERLTDPAPPPLEPPEMMRVRGPTFPHRRFAMRSGC